MPVAVSYPGVYVEEIPSGVRTITGVATSITAFLGRAARGPVNEAVVINNYGDFERQFGGLGVDYPMSYAVKDFYLNGGSQAIIVRLYKPYFADEAARLAAIADAKQKAQVAADAVAKAAGDKAGENPVPTAQEVVDAAEAKATEINDNANSTPAAKAAATAIAAAAAKKLADDPAAGPQDIADAASDAVTGTVTEVSDAAGPRSRAVLVRNNLKFEAASAGAWGNNLRIRVEDAPDGKYNLTVRDGSTGTTEKFLNLTSDDGARRVDRVLKNESALLRVQGDPPYAKPNKHNDDPPADKIWTDANFSTGAGNDAQASDSKYLETADDYEGKLNGKTGMYALEDADLFNLLCIPADKRNDSGADTVANEAYKKAMPYCAKRRAMLLVDPPSSWRSANDIVKTNAAALTALGLNGDAARNAALYFPRVMQADPLRDGQIESFVPCGMIAGVMARTDSQRGVWKAPAGIDASLNGTSGLDINLTDAENGQLNPLGVNCLRSFPVYGRVVWGSRTMRGADQAADEWKYVPVRRTALYIEESLFRGLKWVVFEPNDEPLWAQIRLNVGAFMHNMFRQGAFQGINKKDAYFVKCDKETTTQNDINLGIVNIVVGFAPLKPAEFVIIKLQQMAGQIEV